MKNTISTKKAPGAIGPYSQGVAFGNMIITSGQLGINPETGLLGNGVAEQTELSLKNVKAILESDGFNMANIVKTTVFIKNMDDFAIVNNVYERFFEGDYPARSCVEVAKLPKNGLVEIEVTAVK